ncbi:MAG TPA: hypothetical protein VFK02_34590 [Kofleriaceae bacterium]|nr:hypothetical protein [Kofleriaceae bacterium]
MARAERLPDHGLPDDELPDRDLLERIWSVASRWAVPVMMTLAYVLLAATSDTDTTGKAWMGVGLGFVLVVWFVFRALADAAALARAFSVGDVTRLEQLAERRLAHTRRPAARARLVVARAFAHQLRGELAEGLAALADVEPPPDLAPLARAIRIGCSVELDRPADEAGEVGEAPPGVAPRAPWLAALCEGELAWRAGQLDRAARELARVVDDVRAGNAARAIAHVYAARVAEARGEARAAARHRSAAASLAAPDAAWLRSHASTIAAKLP